uniref:Putative secretory peptide-54 n=1 Tax=Pleurobrachia bachei TaxID=34499 RepID=M4H2I9_PLEBA|nr:putative secretory peptide-54 [Pleurobrachia bachei]|eukprot:sb/3471992/
MIRLLLFTTALCGTVVLAEWIAVEKHVNIPWDLEGKPLQIKTDSKLHISGEAISVEMYDIGGSWIGGVKVLFSIPSMKYQIINCNDYIALSVQPPAEVEKIWKITKTGTALIITCNYVEVLNYQFSDSSNSNCVTKWGSDVVEQIKFDSTDKASDFYRAGKGLKCINTTTLNLK